MVHRKSHNSAGSFLQKRGIGYVFRRKVPKKIQERLSKRELVKSLGPCDFQTALAKARVLAVETDRLFFEAMSKKELTNEVATGHGSAAFGVRQYAAPAEVARLADVVEKIDYGIDVAGIGKRARVLFE